MKSHGMTLYAKEMKASRFEIGVAAFVGALLVLFILAKQGRVPDMVPVVVAFLPLAVWHMVAIVVGVNSLRSEWSARTSYLLNTLPVPGWKVLGAKLLAIMTAYAGTSLIGIVAGLAMAKNLMQFQLSDVLQVVTVATAVKASIGLYIAYSLTVAGLVVMSQLAYLASTLVARLGWLLAIATFFTSSWAVVRIGQVIGIAFQWVPDWYIPAVSESNGMATTTGLPVHMGPLVGAALVGVGLFLLASRILEREAEV